MNGQHQTNRDQHQRGFMTRLRDSVTPSIGETIRTPTGRVPIAEIIGPHPLHAHLHRVRAAGCERLVQHTPTGWAAIQFLRDIEQPDPNTHR